MERFLKTTSVELRVTFYGDAGVPVDATGTPTVTITRESGTAIVTAANTTKVPSTTGIYSYTLTATQTALLDRLAAAWTGVLGGQSQTVYTEAEIVGGHVCSIEQINDALDRGGTASAYDIDLRYQARDVATDAFEAEAGVALTPRYERRTFDGTGTCDLLLSTTKAHQVRSVNVDDVALTSTELGELALYETGSKLYRPAGWPYGRQNIEVVWEHGFRHTPADCQRAVAVLAAHTLKDGPWDDRGFGVTDEGGAVRLLTAGVSGASFSIPEVQAALNRHGYRLFVG